MIQSSRYELNPSTELQKSIEALWILRIGMSKYLKIVEIVVQVLAQVLRMKECSQMLVFMKSKLELQSYGGTIIEMYS